MEAEAHSVWRSPKGELVNITPHHDGEKRILFLCDRNMAYSCEKIGGVRLALTGSLLAVELIDLSNRMDKIVSDYKLGTGIPDSDLRERILPIEKQKRAIIAQMSQKAERNDPCTCMSELKYKKCCGRDW